MQSAGLALEKGLPSNLDAERFVLGSILIDDKDLSALADDERTDFRAKNMGFVFQAFNLLPVLTAVENVEIPLLLLGWTAKRSRERSMETLEAKIGSRIPMH